MQTSYATDSKLFDRSVNLINKVFPGAKRMIAKGREFGANWQAASIPFLIERNGDLVAYLGIVPISIKYEGLTHVTAALHGICVAPSWRGQGFFKQLIQEAQAHIQNHFDSTLLFTDKTTLYQPYGYQVIPQNDFIVTRHYEEQTDDWRQLYFEQPEDLALFKNLYHARIAYNSAMHLNHETLFIINSLDMKLYYSKQQDVIIVCRGHQNRYLQDIVSRQLISLKQLLNTIPSPLSELCLQFYPGGLLDVPYQVVPSKSKGSFMACSRFMQPQTPFRWSEMARC